MEQKDYLLKRLEALTKLIALLLGLKENGNIKEGIEKIDESFGLLTGFTIEEIEKLTSENFITYLINNKKTNNQLECLAELLYWKGKFILIQKDDTALTHFHKSLLLFQYLQNTDKLYSLQRQEKIAELTVLLKQGKLT